VWSSGYYCTDASGSSPITGCGSHTGDHCSADHQAPPPPPPSPSPPPHWRPSMSNSGVSDSDAVELTPAANRAAGKLLGLIIGLVLSAVATVASGIVWLCHRRRSRALPLLHERSVQLQVTVGVPVHEATAEAKTGKADADNMTAI